MTAQFDQRVPLPSLCRRRVWLVLKPMFLLMALAAAVGIVRWGEVPNWNSLIRTQTALSNRETDDASSTQAEQTKEVTTTPDSRVQSVHLTVEERVIKHLGDVHPMIYGFEQEQIAAAIAELGEAAIPSLTKVIAKDSLNGAKIERFQLQVALFALAKIGPASIPSLKSLRDASPDGDEDWRFDYAIQQMDGDLSSLSDEYEVDWDNMSSSVSRSIGFRMLPKIDPSEELLQKYIALLGHADATVLRNTLTALPPFGEKLVEHTLVIQRHLSDPATVAEAVIALWAISDSEIHNTLKDSIISWSTNAAYQSKFLTVLSSPYCPGLAKEFAARIRVLFDESKGDWIRMTAARILIDVDPSWTPPQAELLRLMEHVNHSYREGLFYILDKRGMTILQFLNDRRHSSQADIARAKQLLADAESTDSTVREAAVARLGLVDSYTHPLYVALLLESRNSRGYADWAVGKYSTGYWLPTWLRLRAYKSLINQSPKTFYNDGSYSGSHLRDLKEMRRRVLQDCPELLGEYDVLVRFVESQEVDQP